MQRLIIGCGNADRGDDAAGLLAARRLRELGIEAVEHSGEGLSLMESWQGCDSVVLIDAVVTGAVPGTVTFWDGGKLPAIADVFRCSTHVFGIGEAVRLASVLGRMPVRLSICGIEGQSFELGSEACAEVVAAVEEVAQFYLCHQVLCTAL